MSHPAGTWAEQIEALTPPDERLSWLKVRWHPVFCRWMVWQLLPPNATPLLVLDVEQKLVRHPTRGHCMPDPTSKLLLDREMVDQPAWDLYEQTGRYGRSYWVVQGEHGGHKRRFSNVEKQLARLHGKRLEPPAPGDLPYAPVDRRVFDKLAPYDQLLGWEYAFRRDEADPAMFTAQEREAMVGVKGQYWRWLESQVDAAFDSVETLTRRVPIPVRDDAPRIDYDAEKARILTAE